MPSLLDISAVQLMADRFNYELNNSGATQEEVQEVIDEVLGQPGGGENPGGGGTPIEFPITIAQGGTGVTTAEEVRKLITGFNDVFTTETNNGINIGTGNYTPTNSCISIGNDILSSTSKSSKYLAIGNNIYNAYTGNIVSSICIGNDIGTDIDDSSSTVVLIGNDITTQNLIKDTTALGNQALRMRKSAIDKTVAIGHRAGSAGPNESTAGMSNNVFIGYDAGYQTLGSSVVAIGKSAASGNLTITRSVVIGTEASVANTGDTTLSTSQSVFIGEQSGNRRRFTNCVGIGYGAMNWYDSDYTTITNSIAIGYQSTVTGDNQCQLGNSSVITYVYGTVQTRSDARDKANITPLEYDYIKFIDALKPRNFQWDMREDYMPDASDVEIDENGSILNPAPAMDQITPDGTHIRSRRHNGFIAQEVKEAADELGFDFAGYQDHSVNGGMDVLSLGYEEFIAPMVAYMQELRQEVRALQQQNQQLQDRLAVLESK